MSERTVPARPRARAEGVVVRELPEEVLVYDLDTHKAVCLNSTAAAVWRLCDGRRTASDIRRSLEKSSGDSVPEELVWLALEQLGKDSLLDTRPPRPSELAGLSRRELIKRIGLATAIAIPAVASIVAPTAVEAGASCTPQGVVPPSGNCVDCCNLACDGNGRCI